MGKVTAEDPEVNGKESGVKANALEPVQPPEQATSKVAEKYSELVEEPVIYKESRVKLINYKFPGGKKEGGLPRNATGADGLPLLLPVSTVDGKAQQYLHRLAASRLTALNERWQRDHPDKDPLKLCSGWRFRAFENYKKYHEYCARENRWLPKRYGTGAASKENLVNPGDPCTKWKAFYSPHETGLAMDFGNNGLTASSKRKGQKNTVLFKWLQQNAHLFGITPLLHEAWHWEVNVPLDAWVSGEEFITADDYAVRVKGQGKLGEISPNVSAGSPDNSSSGGSGKCGKKSTVGSGRSAKDLKDFKVMQPEFKGVKPGTQFPTKRKRDIASITHVVIHETAGGFGTTHAPDPVKRDPRCVATLYIKGLSTHFTIDRFGNTKQHLPIDQIAGHAGSLNAASIGIDLVNYVFVKEDLAKKLINGPKKGSPPKKPHHMIKKPFPTATPYFLLNSDAQLKALYRLLQQLAAKCPNLPHKYPCAEGSFLGAGDPRYKNPGMSAHKRSNPNHSDGTFAEWYCANRKAGQAAGDAWWVATGVFVKQSDNRYGPWETPSVKRPGPYRSKAKEEIDRVRNKLMTGMEKLFSVPDQFKGPDPLAQNKENKANADDS